MDERIAFAMLNLVGREVRVSKLNGCILTGVFCSSSTPSSPADKDGFTLRYVTHISGEKPSQEFGPRDRVKIAWSEIESVLAVKSGGPVGWESTSESTLAPANKKKMETDAKISKKSGMQERSELKAVPKEWLAVSANIAPSQDKFFDQFAVNEAKFGVKSTYREELYTTELDKNKVTPEQSARADRIAREIEQSATTNPHILEERGKKPVDDSWDNEEAKHSAVISSGDQGQSSNKYRPPSKRGAGGQGSLKPVPTAPSTTPTPTSTSAPTPSQTPTPAPPPFSYASMVKEGGKPKQVQQSVQAPASQPPAQLAASKPADAPTAPPATKSSKSVSIPVTDKEKKKREDEIREFKEFSQSYVSPSAKPSKAGRTTPPNLVLEAAKEPKKDEQPVDDKKPSSEASSESSTTAAPATAAPAATTGKKALNPNAKNFNPSAPAFVPQAPVQMAYPAAGAPAVVMAPPQNRRFMHPPPPNMIPYQGAMQFPAPPGGFVVPVPVSYGAGGRPVVYYPPPHQQMFAPQQMLIPIQYATNLPTPPPPMTAPMMPLPPPASPQQQPRNMT